MYKSSSVFFAAVIFLIFSILGREWVQFLFSLACFCFATYILLVVENSSSQSGSVYSQLALFTLGALGSAIGVLAFLWAVDKAQAPGANWFFLIIGFVIFPMCVLMGLAMCLCALFSRKTSHAWLMYLVTEPGRYILPVGVIPSADRVRDADRSSGKGPHERR